MGHPLLVMLARSGLSRPARGAIAYRSITSGPATRWIAPHALALGLILANAVLMPAGQARGEEALLSNCGAAPAKTETRTSVVIGEPVAQLRDVGLITRIAWNADSTRIAATSASLNRVALWSIPDGTQLYSSPLLGIGNDALVFVSDELLFTAPASFTGDRSKLIGIVDAKAGKYLQDLPAGVDTEVPNLLISIATDRQAKRVAAVFRPARPILRFYRGDDWAQYTDFRLIAKGPDRVDYNYLAMTPACRRWGDLF
jgi:hypothetical protein